MHTTESWERSLPEPARRRRAERLRARRRRRLRRWLATALALALLIALVVLAAGHSPPQAATHRAPAGSSASLPAQLGLTHPPTSLLRTTLRGRMAIREDRAISRVLAYTQFVRYGGRRRREVALTFDDGPGPFTPEVIRVLRRVHAPATFFETAFLMRYFHASTAREVADGFPIGDHTATHPRIGRLPKRRQLSEILGQADSIRPYGAPFPRMFRPPFGSFNGTTLSLLRRLHMLMVLWTVDSRDYALIGAKAIVKRVVQGARPGAIILMHDAGGNRSETVTAIPFIVRKLRARHYHLVTVPRMMLDDPPLHGQRLPTALGGN